MSKSTKTGKEFGTVNNLLASLQSQEKETVIAEPVIPELMKPDKTISRPQPQKFLREIPIPRNSYPLLLNQEQFCELLSITRRTAAEYRVTYGIPYVSLPNRIFYRVEDVQDFLDRHTVRAERKGD